MKKLQIAVIGSAGPEEYPEGANDFGKLYGAAYEIGRLLAEAGAIVITGGKSGIMEGASKGAKEAGGITVGFVRGNARRTSNAYVDIEIVTNVGNGGDALMIPTSADGAIVIGGGAGTLKEICGFYLEKKPIVLLGNSRGWTDRFPSPFLDERKLIPFLTGTTGAECVSMLLRQLGSETDK